MSNWCKTIWYINICASGCARGKKKNTTEEKKAADINTKELEQNCPVPRKLETRQQTSSLLRISRKDGIIGTGLEPVNLDGGLVQSVLNKEGGNLGTLVSLKLDNLPHLLVFDKSTVAGEFLGKPSGLTSKMSTRGTTHFLECFQELLLVIFCWKDGRSIGGTSQGGRDTHVSVSPVEWSKSYVHYVVGYEYEYNRR